MPTRPAAMERTSAARVSGSQAAKRGARAAPRTSNARRANAARRDSVFLSRNASACRNWGMAPGRDMSRPPEHNSRKPRRQASLRGCREVQIVDLGADLGHEASARIGLLVAILGVELLPVR